MTHREQNSGCPVTWDDTPERLGGCQDTWQATPLAPNVKDDPPSHAPTLTEALAVRDVERLAEAAGHARLALAGYVSRQSAIDKLDAALAAMEGRKDGL